MTDTGNTIDYIELTARLGLPDHEQSAVLSWTNEDATATWTEDEAEELIGRWHADTARIHGDRESECG